MADDPADDEVGDARLRFPTQVRRDLHDRFVDAVEGRLMIPSVVESESAVFIGTLEGYAEGIPAFKEVEPEEQKRRREKVRALAVALENLHAALGKLDSAALGYAYWCGWNQAKNAGLVEEAPPLGMLSVLEATLLRADILPALAGFSGGVRRAVDSLPAIDFDCRLRTALAVERTFFDFGIPFTVTNSGFAATCLRAVFALGGLDIDRVDYWLTKARDSEESMASVNARLSGGGQKSADQ